MKPFISLMAIVAFVAATGAGAPSDAQTPVITHDRTDASTTVDRVIDRQAAKTLAEGRYVFRFDTFGDEAFWGDTLQLHQAIEGTPFGGVGPGASPAAALAVGLKVDVDALPDALIDSLKRGQVDLNDPATTLVLLKLNAVIGVTGFFAPSGSLRSIGIQCSLCHSTVDNSFAPGIGHRLGREVGDGVRAYWPRRQRHPCASQREDPANHQQPERSAHLVPRPPSAGSIFVPVQKRVIHNG